MTYNTVSMSCLQKMVFFLHQTNKQNIVPLSCLNQKSLHYPGGKGCGLSHVVVRVLWST